MLIADVAKCSDGYNINIHVVNSSVAAAQMSSPLKRHLYQIIWVNLLTSIILDKDLKCKLVSRRLSCSHCYY